MLSILEFVAFLEERAKAKDGYIMGATGQNPKSLSAWWFNQYTGSQRTAADGWKKTAARVWDCQGLADGYLTEKLGENINVRARNNYANWCKTKGTGLIPANKRVSGAAVFWGDKASTISHVAFLTRPVKADKPDGDWYMVEARGVKYGVVTTQLLSRKPQFWGYMDKYFTYDAADVGLSEPWHVCTGNSVNVRKGPGTEYPSIGKLYKGDTVNVIQIPEDWIPVLHDGEIRFMSKHYISNTGG